MACQKRTKNHPQNHSPSYLVHTRHGYYFRYRVPADLQRLLGIKSELRQSLKTGSIREAKEKSRLLAGQIQKLFWQLRRKGSYMASELSESQIQDIIKGYVRDVLEDDEQERVMPEMPVSDHVHGELLSGYDYMIENFKRELALCDYSNISKVTDRVLGKRNFDDDRESNLYKLLCRELLKEHVRLVQRLKQRELAEYSEEIDSLPLNSVHLTAFF